MEKGSNKSIFCKDKIQSDLHSHVTGSVERFYLQINIVKLLPLQVRFCFSSDRLYSSTDSSFNDNNYDKQIDLLYGNK